MCLRHDRRSTSIVVALSRRGRSRTRSGWHRRISHHLFALSGLNGLLSVCRAGVLIACLVAAETRLVRDRRSLEGTRVTGAGGLLFSCGAQRWEGRGVGEIQTQRCIHLIVLKHMPRHLYKAYHTKDRKKVLVVRKKASVRE